MTAWGSAAVIGRESGSTGSCRPATAIRSVEMPARKLPSRDNGYWLVALSGGRHERERCFRGMKCLKACSAESSLIKVRNERYRLWSP